MGCNINICLEEKRGINGVEEWVNCDFFEQSLYYNDEGTPLSKYSLNPCYCERSYPLFALLAGVKNNYNIKPISEPKGLPDNVSPLTRDEFASWEGAVYSPSYLTVKELFQAQRDICQKVAAYEGVDVDGDSEFWWHLNAKKDLANLINAIQSHMHRLLRLFNIQGLIDNAENIRIVFWFDS